MKDQFATRGVRTTAGSRILADNVPDDDATVVARLTAAGGILLGKLNLTEFALGGTIHYPFGQPRNPWNTDHDTGGSSAGSGAAVAAGLCSRLARRGHRRLGALTGLVVRRRRPPARRGAWSRATAASRSPGRSTRRARSAAPWRTARWRSCSSPGRTRAIRSPRAAACPNYRAALTREVRGLRVGVIRELTHGAETDPEMRAARRPRGRRAARARRGRRARSRCRWCRVAGAAFMAICDSEGAGAAPALAAHAGPPTTTRARAGACSPPACCPRRWSTRRSRRAALIRRQLLDALATHDVLVAPTAHRPAPAIASATAPITSKAEAATRFFTRRSFTTPAALAGVPALAVPCGFSAAGLPLSLQIIGRRFDDATVLRVGHAYEQATDWHRHGRPVDR